jgi:hypothetical protein
MPRPHFEHVFVGCPSDIAGVMIERSNRRDDFSSFLQTKNDLDGRGIPSGF